MVIAILLLIAAAAVTLDLTQAQAANGVYDTDGDRLIEVSSLEQLDAIRHDLDGDGRADSASYNPRYAAAFPASGSEAVCAAGCADYELKLSLDFDSAGSYAGDINYAWSSLEGWPPINGFRATFDGNGNTISNLYVNRSDADNIGLFGSGGRTAAIKGIGLLNADVTGQRNVGTLLGRNTGTVSYSYAAGSATSVVGDHNTGGLVGANEGTVTTSYASVTIALPRGSAGGLVGMNYEGTISSSYATGPVSSGGSFVGELVSENYGGTISSSYATGRVTGNGLVGGLVGFNFGAITASYATGSLSGDSGVGGLVGHNDGAVSSS